MTSEMSMWGSAAGSRPSHLPGGSQSCWQLDLATVPVSGSLKGRRDQTELGPRFLTSQMGIKQQGVLKLRGNNSSEERTQGPPTRQV